MSVDGFVFVDLETTGTVASEHEILEIGFALYSADLEPLERLVLLPITTATSAVIERMRTDPTLEYVGRMHTHNGLLAELEAAIDASDALPADLSGYQDVIVDTLLRWGVDGSTPLSGCSHRMDREFLARWLPKVDTMFSYRMIDARSFCEAGLILDAERTTDRLKLVDEYGQSNHRVAEDMHYAANLLRVFHDRAPIPFVEERAVLS